MLYGVVSLGLLILAMYSLNKCVKKVSNENIFPNIQIVEIQAGQYRRNSENPQSIRNQSSITNSTQNEISITNKNDLPSYDDIINNKKYTLTKQNWNVNQMV